MPAKDNLVLLDRKLSNENLDLEIRILKFTSTNNFSDLSILENEDGTQPPLS